MADKFKQGQSVYSLGGHKFQVEGYTTDGRLIAQQLVEIDTFEGDVEEHPSGEARLFNADALFASPPKSAIDADIKTKTEELAAIRTQLLDAQQRLRAQDGEHQARLKKLKQHEALARLEDFVEGRLTHVVTGPDYAGRVEVKTFAEAFGPSDSWDKGVKLLSLFGKTNGDLHWGLNRYSDGSGFTSEVRPCASEEEAVKFATDMLQHLWNEFRADSKKWPPASVASAEKLGVAVPSDIREELEQREIQAAQLVVDEARKKLVEAEARLVASYRGEMVA